MEKWKACMLAFVAAVQKIAHEAWLALQKAWAAFVAAIFALACAFCRDVRALGMELKQMVLSLGDKLQRLIRLWFS